MEPLRSDPKSIRRLARRLSGEEKFRADPVNVDQVEEELAIYLAPMARANSHSTRRPRGKDDSTST